MPRPYSPPVLDKRVRIRNPKDRPVVPQNRYGGRLEESEWGHNTWANQSDRSASTVLEAEAQVQIARVVWTIRFRTNVDSDAQVVYRGKVWNSIGPPIIRGGAGHGRAAKYLELHTRLRA